MEEEIFKQSEKQILEYFIANEASKQSINLKADIASVKKRKMIFTCGFAVITLALLSLHFFHTGLFLGVFELINILVYVKFMKKYNTMSFLIKEVQARPDEDISYIVASHLSETQSGSSQKWIRRGVILLSIVIPLLIFLRPHIMYEAAEAGYYVRFYTTGVLGERTIEIPQEYNGKPVVGIRGDVFAHLYSVEEIILPETIRTIRGGAFKSCYDLVKVNIPKSLTYLGGEAFVDCEKIERIDLPIGITEIKGNTFEACIGLKEINIPEGVTRIAARAFYRCDSLTAVNIPSTVEEIGSSAFRSCSSLKTATISEKTMVNSKAFKESPTQITYY